MTITYNASLKSTRMQAVITALDDGASNAVIEICTAGYAEVLVAINLAKPSFTESNGTLSMASPPRSGVAGNSGAAAMARVKDSNNNYEISGLTVGEADADVILNDVDITAGQTVTLTAGTIQHG